jgi:hypothetical protein
VGVLLLLIICCSSLFLVRSCSRVRLQEARHGARAVHGTGRLLAH